MVSGYVRSTLAKVFLSFFLASSSVGTNVFVVIATEFNFGFTVYPRKFSRTLAVFKLFGVSLLAGEMMQSFEFLEGAVVFESRYTLSTVLALECAFWKRVCVPTMRSVETRCTVTLESITVWFCCASTSVGAEFMAVLIGLFGTVIGSLVLALVSSKGVLVVIRWTTVACSLASALMCAALASVIAVFVVAFFVFDLAVFSVPSLWAEAVSFIIVGVKVFSLSHFLVSCCVSESKDALTTIFAINVAISLFLAQFSSPSVFALTMGKFLVWVKVSPVVQLLFRCSIA